MVNLDGLTVGGPAGPSAAYRSGLRRPHATRTRTRTGRHPAARLATRILAGLTVAVLVAACGAAATPTPAPSPTPTATPAPTAAPSPTPDLAEIVAKRLIQASHGSMILDGELTVAGIAAPLSGSMEFSSQGSRSLMTVRVGEAVQTTERVTIGGVGWSRQGSGPWLEDPAPPSDSSSIVAVLRGLNGLEDVGIEAYRGAPAHRLRPAAGEGFPPEAFGFDSPSISSPSITVDFLATGDGTPLAMLLTGDWTQAVNGAQLPVSVSLTIDFNWDLAVSITAPDDVWVVHASSLGYSMAHPADWTVLQTPEGDDFQLQGESLVYVRPQTLAGAMTSEQFRDELVKFYQSDLGTPPESDATVTLGGQAAHLLTYRIPVDGGVNVLFDCVTTHGGQGWEVFLVTPDGSGLADDLRSFQTFVATFSFSG
jgi:hypothetical protein